MPFLQNKANLNHSYTSQDVAQGQQKLAVAQQVLNGSRGCSVEDSEGASEEQGRNSRRDVGVRET